MFTIYLNCHSYYSTRYGTISEIELLELAERKEIRYLALTDINSTSAILIFLKVAIIYLEENSDAKKTKEMVEKEGRQCLLIEGDVTDDGFCEDAVRQCASSLGGLNIVVNNAAVQFPQDDFGNITAEQVKVTFETNIYGYFNIVRHSLDQMKEGDCIINTSSVTAYRGSEHLVDYASTKGAIVSFTRSLSKMLAQKKIRVNGVAPGPIWTPLIPATFKDVSDFGQDTPMGRAGQPSEVGPAYAFSLPRTVLISQGNLYTLMVGRLSVLNICYRPQLEFPWFIVNVSYRI